MSSELGKDLIDGPKRVIGVFFGDAHRGFDAENVSIKAALSDEDLVVTEEFVGSRCLLLCGHFRLPVFHQLDTDHQSLSSDVSDDVVFLLEASKTVEEMISDDERVLLNSILFDGPESCPSHST